MIGVINNESCVHPREMYMKLLSPFLFFSLHGQNTLLRAVRKTVWFNKEISQSMFCLLKLCRTNMTTIEFNLLWMLASVYWLVEMEPNREKKHTTKITMHRRTLVHKKYFNFQLIKMFEVCRSSFNVQRFIYWRATFCLYRFIFFLFYWRHDKRNICLSPLPEVVLFLLRIEFGFWKNCLKAFINWIGTLIRFCYVFFFHSFKKCHMRKFYVIGGKV